MNINALSGFSNLLRSNLSGVEVKLCVLSQWMTPMQRSTALITTAIAVECLVIAIFGYPHSLRSSLPLIGSSIIIICIGCIRLYKIFHIVPAQQHETPLTSSPIAANPSSSPSSWQKVKVTLQNCWQWLSRFTPPSLPYEFEQSLKADFSASEKKLNLLKWRVNEIEQFVMTRPQLRTLCERRWQDFAHRVITPDRSHVLPIDKTELIDRIYALRLQISDNECVLNNYRRFVNSYPDVRAAIERCILEEQEEV
ncbi:MAG: hypothetical protein HW387_737 [Parachlamydiales bacterium]|nr:hypothetical protein [Parachlamydiales bacterium]